MSSTSVTAVSPAATNSGSVNVTVTTPGGTSATSTHNSFDYLPTPSVTGVSPPSGPDIGGTTVTITGTNLSGAKSVQFGTTAGTVTADSATSITATSPAGSGMVNVTVTTAYGTSATSSEDEFTYAPAHIVPCSGPITADSRDHRWHLPGQLHPGCPRRHHLGHRPRCHPEVRLWGLTVEGTLDVAGTASNPITFTSFNDNTVGGTTGSGNPAVGDWYGIDADGPGSIDLNYAIVDYANAAVSLSGSSSLDAENSIVDNAFSGVTGQTTGSVVVKDNQFSSDLSSAVNVNVPTPTIENNTAVDSGGGASPAYLVNASALDPAVLGGNVASGGAPLFSILGIVGSSGTLPANGAPWLILGSGSYNPGSLDVPTGVTLTIRRVPLSRRTSRPIRSPASRSKAPWTLRARPATRSPSPLSMTTLSEARPGAAIRRSRTGMGSMQTVRDRLT